MRLQRTILIVGVLAMAGFAMPQRPYARYYDPAKEITVQGTVQEVLPAQRGAATGIHLKVKWPDGILEVRIGPAWFIEQKQITFAAGDQIEATGVPTATNTGEAFIARTVKKGGSLLVLRDANGFPLWSGGKGKPKG
jgi:hypothetical protein